MPGVGQNGAYKQYSEVITREIDSVNEGCKAKSMTIMTLGVERWVAVGWVTVSLLLFAVSCTQLPGELWDWLGVVYGWCYRLAMGTLGPVAGWLAADVTWAGIWNVLQDGMSGGDMLVDDGGVLGRIRVTYETLKKAATSGRGMNLKYRLTCGLALLLVVLITALLVVQARVRTTGLFGRRYITIGALSLSGGAATPPIGVNYATVVNMIGRATGGDRLRNVADDGRKALVLGHYGDIGVDDGGIPGNGQAMQGIKGNKTSVVRVNGLPGIEVSRTFGPVRDVTGNECLSNCSVHTEMLDCVVQDGLRLTYNVEIWEDVKGSGNATLVQYQTMQLLARVVSVGAVLAGGASGLVGNYQVLAEAKFVLPSQASDNLRTIVKSVTQVAGVLLNEYCIDDPACTTGVMRTAGDLHMGRASDASVGVSNRMVLLLAEWMELSRSGGSIKSNTWSPVVAVGYDVHAGVPGDDDLIWLRVGLIALSWCTMVIAMVAGYFSSNIGTSQLMDAYAGIAGLLKAAALGMDGDRQLFSGQCLAPSARLCGLLSGVKVRVVEAGEASGARAHVALSCDTETAYLQPNKLYFGAGPLRVQSRKAVKSDTTSSDALIALGSRCESLIVRDRPTAGSSGCIDWD